ncbi:Protein AIM2 [Sparassis crispa]|uniref:Protein AIM2 n=1 Tax=Sparassis crispa TaxID=139825 RepID=A0A401GLQ9_9APHY|nr:Protein AIM2 [Sparassis crispa]GBE83069.1 Protein AIM2 [Sparassis crispa]
MACVECVSGSLHSGTPIGQEISLEGISAYAVGDESSKRIIVFGTDIFGWKFNNTRLLADEYASRGFRVLIPDLFDGYELPQWTLASNDPVNETPTLFQRLILRPFALFVLVPFVLRHSHSDQSSKINKVVNHLRQTYSEAKIGFIGFCWGGRYAITMNASFDASVAAHPSLVKFPADLEGISKPISFALSETDHNYNKERGDETKSILEKKGFTDFEVVVYEGVNHGWTVRGNMSDPHKKDARDRAKEQALAWFEKYLSITPV